MEKDAGAVTVRQALTLTKRRPSREVPRGLAWLFP
jgi:hypothetical protein